MSREVRAGVILATIFLLILGPATPALADHLEIETSVPGSARAGDVIEMRVVVRTAEAGVRVPGAEVVVLRRAEFLGVSGDVELARAVADDRGVAVLRFQARSGTDEQILVATASVGDAALESRPVSVITIDEGPQIVVPKSGVRIPGFGVWVLVGLVIVIWAIIQFALLGPVEVARLGEEARSADAREPA